MIKNIITFENGFYSSPLLPKDMNGDFFKYAYFEDIAKLLMKLLKKEVEI